MRDRLLAQRQSGLRPSTLDLGERCAQERQRLKKQVAAIHRKHPDLKVLVHIAHSLYCTDNPDRYHDSQVIGPDGKQAIWGVPPAYISRERQDAGWKFWIFYPTPGNRFHDSLDRRGRKSSAHHLTSCPEETAPPQVPSNMARVESAPQPPAALARPRRR